MKCTPTHSVSVTGIVVNESQRILVIRRRDNGHWEPPGGILELNESFEEGVRREILEETGVTVQVDRLSGIYKNLSIGVVALVFRCTPRSTITRTHSDEAEEIRWVDLASIPDLMDPAFAVRVSDAFTDSPPSRVHDGTQLINR